MEKVCLLGACEVTAFAVASVAYGDKVGAALLVGVSCCLVAVSISLSMLRDR